MLEAIVEVVSNPFSLLEKEKLAMEILFLRLSKAEIVFSPCHM